MKHTPGPWKTTEDYAYRGGQAHPGWRIDSNTTALMAWIETGLGDKEEVAANAQLMAAAPTLLTALTGLVDACEAGALVPSHGNKNDVGKHLGEATRLLKSLG